MAHKIAKDVEKNMANQKMQNIKSLGQNPKTRIVLILTVTAVVGALIVGKMATSSKASRPADMQAQVSVGSAPKVEAVPGTSTSARHTELVQEANRQAVATAKDSGGTVIPRLTGQTDGAANPFDLVKKDATAAPVGSIDLETKTANQPAQQQPQQPQQPVVPEKSEAVKAQEAAMAAAMSGLLNAWAPVGQKMEFDHTGAGAKMAMGNTAYSGTGASGPQPGSPLPEAPAKADIKAGHILHAVSITAVNSDEPGPILAEIVSGPYAGARLLGSFTLPANSETLVLQFNSISMKKAPQSFPVNAFAVNPETARTAMASEVNHRYFERYGLLFASAFVKGYGEALSKSGNTQTTAVGTGGAVTTTQYPQLDGSEKAMVALGAVGREFADALKEKSKRPITVKIHAGTPMGILFMADAVFKN